MRARKALNGRDVLGSDVRAIHIGFARVPIKILWGCAVARRRLLIVVFAFEAFVQSPISQFQIGRAHV